MKHEKLKKSPLAYVLAQVKISSIENIEKYVPELQDDIRKEDFPTFNKINLQTIEINENIKPNICTATQWHFKDKESETGILLDKQAITIHTSRYQGFDAFTSTIKKVLTVFNKTLGIALSTRIALRYINVVQTNIEKYINRELLGFYNKADKEFLSNTETIHRNEDEDKYTVIRSTHNKNFRISEKNLLIPLDLASVANHLSFEHQKQPENDYVIIDIDNFYRKQSEFDIQSIMKKLSALHSEIYDIFCNASTSDALKSWT